MAVYLFTSISPKVAMIKALQERHPDNFALSERMLAFRVQGPTNAKDILLPIQAPDEEKRGVILSQITGDYWGFAAKPFWDWLEAAFRSDLG